MTVTNPLRRITCELTDLVESSQKADKNLALSTHWRRTKGIPNDADYTLHVAQLISHLTHFRAEVLSKRPSRSDYFLQAINKLLILLSRSHTGTINTLHSIITPDLIRELDLLSDAADQFASETVINPETISDLITDLQDIVRAVADSDLPARLKHLLSNDLFRLIQAFENYERDGATDPSQALDSLYATLLRQRDVISAATTAGKNSVLKPLIQLILRVDKFTIRKPRLRCSHLIRRPAHVPNRRLTKSITII